MASAQQIFEAFAKEDKERRSTNIQRSIFKMHRWLILGSLVTAFIAIFLAGIAAATKNQHTVFWAVVCLILTIVLFLAGIVLERGSAIFCSQEYQMIEQPIAEISFDLDRIKKLTELPLCELQATREKFLMDGKHSKSHIAILFGQLEKIGVLPAIAIVAFTLYTFKKDHSDVSLPLPLSSIVGLISATYLAAITTNYSAYRLDYYARLLNSAIDRKQAMALTPEPAALPDASLVNAKEVACLPAKAETTKTQPLDP